MILFTSQLKEAGLESIKGKKFSELNTKKK